MSKEYISPRLCNNKKRCTCFAWLDDEHDPSDSLRNPFSQHFDIIWRDAAEAKNWMTIHGCPCYISFDHDLGCHPYSKHGIEDDFKESGMDLAKWIIDRDIASGYKFLPKDFSFRVHSQNPVGAFNIFSLLNNYLKSIGR